MPEGLTIHPPYLLVNKQGKGQKPVARQGFHVDLDTGQRGGVAIAAVAPTSLLVVPVSHLEVQTYLRLAADVKLKTIPPAADLDAWLASRKFRPVRLELDLGDIVFM